MRTIELQKNWQICLQNWKDGSKPQSTLIINKSQYKASIIYLFLALVTGALIPIQAATNAAFSKSVTNPLITGIMVFVVGFLGMFMLSLIMRTPVASVNQFASAPAYSYLGGLIVATYVVMITILVPRIGVGTSISLIVTGQVLCAVVIDHFGLFNVQVRSIDASRLVGMVLMIARFRNGLGLFGFYRHTKSFSF